MTMKTNGFIEGNLPQDLLKLLLALASTWGDVVDVNAFKVNPLKGAMTNEVFRITWPTKGKDNLRTVLVRVYGEGVELFFDRNEEIRTFECMSMHGHGPRLLGQFRDGRVEEFIYAKDMKLHYNNNQALITYQQIKEKPVFAKFRVIHEAWECYTVCGTKDPMLVRRFDCGTGRLWHRECYEDPMPTLSAADLRDPEISTLIAAKLREFHELDMPGSKQVALWDRLRNWLCKANSLCTQEHVKEFLLEKLEKEIKMLEKELSQGKQDIGFCHNDLQYGNIMIDEITRSITLIDYEYASYNPIAYDLANHFCEMAANYHTDTPHILDYNKYPGLEERQRFICAYLSSAGNEPNDAAIQQLAEVIEKYTLVNHLFWGLWGIISAYVNNIDFDYIEYARQRFQQYWLKKPKILSTSQQTS